MIKADEQYPRVTVKFAQTLDGRVATATGDSQWISSPASRRLAHRLRREHDAVMVGIGTVLADDPMLTVRLVRGRDPLRVILDSHLRIPLDALVLGEGAAHRTLIATTEGADQQRAKAIARSGAEVLPLPAGDSRAGVDLRGLLAALGQRGVRSVLVEGGASVITSFLKERLVDRVVVFIAPRIIGRGTDAVGDLGITRLAEAIEFSAVKVRRLGPDIVFDGLLDRPS